MRKDSPKFFNCEFAPEIVDFLYGEMSNDQKNAFNLHLNKCSACADEIEDFSHIRFSIQDWKAAEFANLSTPKIKIPYQTVSVKTFETVKTASWFDSIRNYLTLSPIMSGALAVVLLAVLFGFGVLFFNNSEKQFVADANVKPNINTNPTAKPTTSVEPEKVVIAENSSESDKNDSTFHDTIPTEKKIIEDSVPVKVTEKTNPKQKTQTVRTVEKKQTVSDTLTADKDSKVTPQTKKPRLNELPEEDEDNSLRLSDLFAELDTKK